MSKTLKPSKDTLPKKKKKIGKKERWPSLNVARQVSNRKEYIDYDYIKDLSDEEKDYLQRFTKEHHIASFDKDVSKRLIKDTKSAYGANNARNRCMLSKAKATGLLDDSPTKEYLDSKVDTELAPYYVETEETIIARFGAMNNADNEYTVEETIMYMEGFINRLLK